MKHKILIIDDEKIQAENIQKALIQNNVSVVTDVAYQEDDILKKISETYFNIAIVDLRMDNFSIDGFKIISEIIEKNPFAKIIVCSAYLPEYKDNINDIITTGRIASILDKSSFQDFVARIIVSINKIIKDYDDNPHLNQKNLEFLYSEVLNEKDNYTKGIRFEYFVTTLFSQMGFNSIINRQKDKSLNEIDIIIRNDIKDNFFNKFKPYFLIECKNTIEQVDKNQFIQFNSKIENAKALSNLGFIFTAKGFKRTAFIEAVRNSKEDHKIVFISSNEIKDIIYSESLISGLKNIIDNQVKDN